MKNKITVIEDPILRALIILVGKAKVKKFFNRYPNQTYHKILDMAGFLVANGIREFGSNDNLPRRKT